MEAWKSADTRFLPVFLCFHPFSKPDIDFLILLRTIGDSKGTEQVAVPRKNEMVSLSYLPLLELKLFTKYIN